MKYTAGFIGAGNMGGALLSAVAKKADRIAVYDTNSVACESAAAKTGAHITDIAQLVSESKFVFLGVKPGVIQSVCSEICRYITNETTVVSMAAGVGTDKLKAWLNTDNVIRIMPNTPAAVGKGMILYCGKATEQFTQIMSGCGKLDLIDEKLIDAAAAISGCGPAFAYMFIEALADGGVKCGLPRARAELYAKQTLLGAAALALESGKHPGALKDAVCSPGGTTIEGVLTLENSAFRSAVSQAVIAAYEKTAGL